MKAGELQEQKGGCSDFLGLVFLLPTRVEDVVKGSNHLHTGIAMIQHGRGQDQRLQQEQEVWGRRSWDEVKERGKLFVSLFIITRGVHSRRETQEREKLCCPCEGRRARENCFKEGLGESIHFINNRSSCSERMYVEEMLINVSVEMISRHILAGIQSQGVGSPRISREVGLCFGDPIRNKKTSFVGRPWW